MRKTLWIGFLTLLTFFGCKENLKSEVGFQNLMTWEREASLPDEFGFAGAFGGFHNQVILYAGGCHFYTKTWQADAKKVYFDRVYVLQEDEKGEKQWTLAPTRLPQPLAYGASVTLPEGVLCLGGMNDKLISNNAFLLKWNSEKNDVEIIDLGEMPLPLANTQATYCEGRIYVAGGQTSLQTPESTTSAFLQASFDGSKNLLKWHQGVVTTDGEGNEYEDVMPAEPRILATVATQFNGEKDSVYVIGGRQELGNNQFVFFSDTWAYNPKKKVGNVVRMLQFL